MVTAPPLGVQRWRVSKASRGESFRVSTTMNLGGLAGLANLLFFVLAQLEVESAQILIESPQICRTWDLYGCQQGNAALTKDTLRTGKKSSP